MCTHSLPSNGITSQVSFRPQTVEQATVLIFERARELVNELVKQRGHENPPFSAQELALLQGIKQIVKTDLGERSALLLRSEDGYIIKINSNHSQVKQNFSCAHEIGHTFIHEMSIQASRGDVEFRTINSDIGGKAVERLCDMAAAELLMPEPVFKKYLSRSGVSVNSIEQLANTFRVSNHAAAIRIDEVSEELCIALLWQRWPKTKPKSFRLAPRRETRDKPHYVVEQTYVRDPSSLLKAYQSDIVAKSFKSLKVGDSKKRCYMESKGFGRNEMRYVISLVFPDRKMSKANPHGRVPTNES